MASHGQSASEPASGPRPAPAAPSGRDTALIAAGQGTLMLLGGVLALLVAQLFGKDARTDAFFAAYGVYAVGLMFSQTFRLTAVARLVGAGGSEAITRLLGAVALITLAAAVPMVVLAGPLGTVLVDARADVAASALRILWIALAGQLLAAMLATVLVVRGAFTIIGVATLLAGFISIGLFVALEGPLGIDAAATGLAASALWLSAAFAVRLLRTGWRPAAPDGRALRAICSEAGRLGFASAIFVAMNLMFVICMALAARLGEGEATLFSYGYVLAVMLVGVTVNVSGAVRSPSVIAGREQASDVAAVGVWCFRFTVALCGPVLAMAMLVGGPLIGFALGSSFSDADSDAILLTLLCLVGWILASAAAMFAIVELLARGALRRLALLGAAQVAALLALAYAGSRVAGIEGLAIALSVASLGAAAVLMRWAFADGWRSSAAEMARAAGREVVVVAVAFGPPALLLLALPESTAATAGAAALAALLVAIASHRAWPRESRAVADLLRRSPPRPPDDRPADSAPGAVPADAR